MVLNATIAFYNISNAPKHLASPCSQHDLPTKQNLELVWPGAETHCTRCAVANERAGYKKDVAKDLQNVQLYAKELAQLLQQSGASPSTAQAIVDLCGYAGWHAANVRAGNKKDAEKDMQQVGRWGRNSARVLILGMAACL
jgi:hypothetical protein